VQKTIDRIIFLRICEDRDIEDYGRLLKLKNKPDIYKGLLQLFRRADERYNSGLFHFKKESAGETFDDISANLVIEDEPLKKLLTGCTGREALMPLPSCLPIFWGRSMSVF